MTQLAVMGCDALVRQHSLSGGGALANGEFLQPQNSFVSVPSL